MTNREIVITSKENPDLKVLIKAPNVKTSIGVFMDSINKIRPEKLNASMAKYDTEGNLLLDIPNILKIKKQEAPQTNNPVKVTEDIIKKEDPVKVFKSRKPFESLSDSYKKQLMRRKEKQDGVYMDKRKNNPGRPKKTITGVTS
jgi:hypothetical protein